MSIKNLLTNTPKPWANLYINDINIGGNLNLTGTISGITFEGANQTSLNSYSQSVQQNVTWIANNNVTVLNNSMYLTRIGNVVTVFIESFEITTTADTDAIQLSAETLIPVNFRTQIPSTSVLSGFMAGTPLVPIIGQITNGGNILLSIPADEFADAGTYEIPSMSGSYIIASLL